MEEENSKYWDVYKYRNKGLFFFFLFSFFYLIVISFRVITHSEDNLGCSFLWLLFFFLIVLIQVLQTFIVISISDFIVKGKGLRALPYSKGKYKKRRLIFLMKLQWDMSSVFICICTSCGLHKFMECHSWNHVVHNLWGHILWLCSSTRQVNR